MSAPPPRLEAATRSYRLYQVDAFTDRPFSGNPAGVVPDARGLDDHEMLCIARELNNSETAFVFPLGPNEVEVRFFTPTAEVPVCGHATIAAHWVRSLEGEAGPRTRQHCRAGLIEIELLSGADGQRLIGMHQRPATFEPPLPGDRRDAVIAALGIDADEVEDWAPIQVVSTGHSKVMVPLRRRTTLRRLDPDPAALARLSGEIGCNGYFAFTLDAPDQGILSHGRMFAPAIGIREDPATGNANGPMGAYLVRHGMLPLAPDGCVRFVARQGESLSRPSTLHVRVSRAAETLDVLVAGEAVVVFATRLDLP